MKYARCKCGESEFWGSGMSPEPCCPCKKCGTIPGYGPDSHPEVRPHEWVETKVETDEGPKTLSRCSWCLKTKKQIEADK